MVTVLYFLNKTVKNFSSQPQNIYAQLSGNFSPIFNGFFSSICAQLVQIERNFSAFSAQFLCEFCTNFAFFSRDFLPGLYVLNSTYAVKHEQNDNSNWICSIVDDTSVNWFYMSH